MNFIVELTKFKQYDAIYICVDRLTKMMHFILTNTTVTAEQTAQLFYRHIWKHYELPADIVSNRGTQFVTKFTQHLLKHLNIQRN